MSEDLSKMSIQELRAKLTVLELERNGKPKLLAMIASASSKQEASDFYSEREEQLGELRALDLRIHALKSAILVRERMENEAAFKG